MARTLGLVVLSLSAGCLYPWDDSESSTTGESSSTTMAGSSGEASTGESTSSGGSTMTGGSGSEGQTTIGSTGSTGGSGSGATTEMAPVCGDGVIAAGEECDDGNAAPDDGCDESCARDRVVFATSMEFPPAQIGGLKGADSLCKQLAHKGDLQRWATFTAWLSDSQTDALARVFHGRGRYVRPDGMVVAQDFEALLAGPLLAPIAIDEYGAAALGGAWTGTRPDGTAVPAAWHCGDWTSSELLELGHYGAVEALDGSWTYMPNPETNPTNCLTSFHLYCFEGP